MGQKAGLGYKAYLAATFGGEVLVPLLEDTLLFMC